MECSASAAAATTESTLLSSLQSSTDLTDIHHQFTTYLHPFTAVQNPKPTKKSSKSTTKPADTSTATLRSLAKQFLPFLNKTLSLLPKRLSETSSPNRIPKQSALDLFDVYRFCLNCLDLITSQLSCKPYSVHIQRARYIHCLGAWELYKEGENEGFSILESLKAIDGGGTRVRAGKGKNRYVPKVNEKSVDQDLALLIVEIVVTLVKCASVNQSKETESYQRILVLLDEAGPWFRVLDANAYEKLHRVFVTYLSRIAVSLVGELKGIGGELAYKFCTVTFAEHRKSSLKDQMYKFARRICSHLFTQVDDQNSYIIDILKLVLESMACECKVGMENAVVEFLELVSYCANKCRTTGIDVCSDITVHLNEISGDLNKVEGDLCQVLSFVGSVLRMYAAGLSTSPLCGQSRNGKSLTWSNAEDGSALKFFVENADMFLQLNGSLLLLKCHFNTCGAEKNLPQNVKSFLLPCFDALKFLCQPLADFVNSEKKEILTETGDSPFYTTFDVIQEAFDQFCSFFLQCHSTAERGRDASDDNHRTLLLVAVAAFTLSCRTKRKIKEISNFIESIISADWIEANDLKYLFASLYNVAVILYRAKRMEEASRALESACKASWNSVVQRCRMFVHKSSKTDDALPEDVIAGLCNEACAKTAFLLDLLHQNSYLEVNRVLRDSLESWSVARSLFEALPSPMPLVKQWVKIQCKDLKDVNVEQNGRTLYSLLSSSAKVSKWTLGIILEQELLAYKDANARNRILCRKMRMEIICILLDRLYVTKDSRIQKSRILISKGSELRANGIEDLKECVQCLSEAITILSDICGADFSCEANRLLVYAYCLRELCTQEAEPNSKVLLHRSLCPEHPVLNSEQQPFQDIHAGVSLCLRPRCCHAADHCHMISEGILNLLYHVLDLLAIKGYMELHCDIYTTMFRLFEWMKIPAGKFLAVLWKGRRLSHALCASPIDTVFLTTFSQCRAEFSSVVYWTKCMEESQPLLVGFQQSFFLMLGVSSQSSDNCYTLQSDVTDEKVKQAASDLISSVPLSSESIFLSAYLYHDLCERLILSGQLIEALFYAKEAHRLRSKLLQEKFVYTIEQPDEIYNETGELIQKRYYKLKAFEVNDSVAAEAWFCDRLSCKFEDFILTPWNVLQCYLESTLQVGIIHEILGNGSEAETLLQWGKSISCQKNLPLFGASFSSILGKMYRKQHLWDLAEKELQSAREMLNENCTTISCLGCKSVMEVSINEQLGDLYRSRCCNSTEGPSIERLSCAMDMSRSALRKLNLDWWENTINSLDAATTEGVKNCGSSLPSNYATDHQNMKAFPSKGGRQRAENESRRHTKAKKERKPLKQVEEHNVRRTRTRCHPFQNNSETLLQSNSMDLHCSSYGPSQRGPESETKCSVSNFLIEIKRLCDQIKCWHCLTLDIRRSTSLSKFVCFRWDLVRRRLILRLLISTGKCLRVCGSTHDACGVFLQCVSLLVNRNLCPQYSPHPIALLFDLIGAETRDMLAIERAALLYHLCLLLLKSCPCNNTRQLCCELSSVEPPRIISWLRLVFILCHEVPLLFQKVSRLLAALYVLSTSVKSLSLLPGKTLSESHWASFFHQASIGTHLDQELICRMTVKQKCQGLKDPEHSSLSRLAAAALGTAISSSLVPISQQDLEEFVISFFQTLPSTRVICISFLAGADASLLTELLGCPSSGQAWLLLSRLNANNQPVTILLPVQSISREEPGDDKDSCLERKDFNKKWQCPWVSSVVDDVAPVFRHILEENYMSSSAHPLEDTKKSRLHWWTRRKELDNCLGDFLRDMEQSWLGPWKYLLSEEWPDFRHLDSLRKKVLDEFNCECHTDACESSPEDAPADAVCAFEKEDCVRQLILNKGCYVGGISCEKCKVLSNTSKTLAEMNKPEAVECTSQKPVILVMDYDAQILPWESLLILRNQEVYRMPSVYSISATLERCCQHQEPVGTSTAIFPSIDPVDSYYVLNPSGDLSSTQAEFENWFKDLHFEGKTGSAPTIEELSEALKSHDLFIYFGHGSGSQYIPRHQIQKLEGCAATILMGCSSGSLSIDGSYAPQGAPLCYLLAGSPVIVANLWEVTDKDIDRFGKTMLDAWLEERSTASTVSECDVIANELKSMSIRTRRTRKKERSSSKKMSETVDNNELKDRRKIGSFMGQARQACTLPFLIGASPVCYGVPTCISKKKDI